MSGIPSQQIDIFNFEEVLGEMRDTLNTIASNYVTNDRFNLLLSELGGQGTPDITVIESQISNLTQAFSKLSMLVQAVIAALKGVATTNLQTLEISLLQQIVTQLQQISPPLATSIGLDLTHVWTTKQPTPINVGP